MKKIISLVLTMLMIASMSVVSFASDYPVVVTIESGELEVGAEGNITLDLVCTFSEESTVGAFAWTFALPEGVEIVSYDLTEWTELMDTAVTDDTSFPTITVYEDDMITPCSGTITIPVTFSVDTSAPAVYTIGSDDSNSMVADGDFNPYNDQENLPTATITVKAPFVAETVEGAKVTSEVSEVTIDGAVYTNVAIFTATLGTGEGNYSEAGFIWVKDDNKTDNKYTVDASVISGGGEVTYTAAMFAIADGVKIEAIPYYVTAK